MTTRLDDGPTEAEAARLAALADRRAAREPLQYILGEWDFMDFSLKVGPGVLCPRADSEVVCETAIELLQGVPSPRVYDLCAGTGCLGLGIARHVPGADVTCVEKSHDAWPYLTANTAAQRRASLCRPTSLPIISCCPQSALISSSLIHPT